MSLLQQLLSESKPKTARPVVVPGSAPRNKQLHDTLSGRKGGRHYDPKSDYVRAKEKHKLRQEVTEGLPGYFWYSLIESGKVMTGCIAESSEQGASALIQQLYPTATNILVGTATADMYQLYIQTGTVD